MCVCVLGMDCSVDRSKAHWSAVPFSASSMSPMEQLPRAGHSAVSVDSYMLVYGGYRFAGGYYSTDVVTPDDIRRGVTSSWTDDDLLRYDFRTNQWEALNTSAVSFIEEGEWEEEEVELPRVQLADAAGDQLNVTLNGNSTEGVATRYAFPSPRYGHTAVVYNVRLWQSYC